MTSTEDATKKNKVSRRNFIVGVGAGAVVGAVAVAGAESLLQTSSPSSTTKTVTNTITNTSTTTVTTGISVPPTSSSIITLNVNGVSRSTNVDNRWSLQDTLRYKFNLIGTKSGCDRGECGACSVLVDGTPMLSCMMLAVAAQGHAITTIEGIGMPEHLSNIQAALCDSDGIQCGACVPGIVIVATAFHKQNPTATDAQWRAALSGNLCKCAAWPHILQGVEAVQ